LFVGISELSENQKYLHHIKEKKEKKKHREKEEEKL
jgi:hypothetical protein